MLAEPESCPDQKTLQHFLQGLLEPPTLDSCEQHVSDCEVCHETLRGLDASDTLSYQLAEAIRETPSENVADRREIDDLVQRLLQPERLGGKFTLNRSSKTELMADKAAEVLRCIELVDSESEDCLGTLGDYRLLRLIGAGGTGVVFQAQDMSLDRVVALKVLRPSLGDVARERFIAEARLAASIEHDNVVSIYQIGQQDRLAFIAMQWIPGETLEARMDRNDGPLDDKTIREFVSQIAAGLAVAHQRQLVHRDIKPANLWICDDTGRIKILDFGLARVASEETSLTRTGMLAGTPSFMSPEQSKGMELDPRSDLFSLGCVMYQLITGKLPFSAPTVLGTLQTIQADSPQPPVAIVPDCDQDLSDLTMSLLEKLPANRMASAEELRACLNSPRKQWPCTIPIVNSVAAEVSPAAIAPKTKSTFAGPGAWVTAAVLTSLLAVTAWWFSPQIIRIATNRGELVVETSDENIKIEVLKNGELFRVLDSSTGDSFEIEAGEYSFQVGKDESSEFNITPNKVELVRGGRKVVSVSITPNQDPKTGLAQGANKLEGEQPFLRTYRISTDLKPAQDLLETIFEGSDVRMGQDKRTNAITVLGKKEDHARVEELLAQLSASLEAAKTAEELALERAVTRTYTVKDDRRLAYQSIVEMLEGSPYFIQSQGNSIMVKAQEEDHVRVVKLLAKLAASTEQADTSKESEAQRSTRTYTAQFYPNNTFEMLERLLKQGGCDAQVSQNEDGKILVVGNEKEHSAAKETLDWIQNRIKTNDIGFTSDEPLGGYPKTPLYGGRDFNYWYQIARVDHEPMTVAEALVACAAIAGENQQEKFLNLFRKLIREHGTAHASQFSPRDQMQRSIAIQRLLSTGRGGRNRRNGGRFEARAASPSPAAITQDLGGFNSGDQTAEYIMRNAFILGFRQMEPKEIAKFFQTEIAEGNEKSLGCCSGVHYEIFAGNGNDQKAAELKQLMDLDVSLLLRRLIDKELKLDSEVTSFLSYAIDSSTSDPGLEVTKEFLKTLPDQIIVEGGVIPNFLYSQFIMRFPAGELDDTITSFFFDPDTERQARDEILFRLQLAGNASGHGGGGFENREWTGLLYDKNKAGVQFQSHNQALLNRLLTRSILKIVNSEQVESKFDITPKHLNETGDSFKPLGPLPVLKLDVVRYLVTTLCQSNLGNKPEGEELEKMLAFLQTLRDSEVALKLFKTQKSGRTKILQDLNALANYLKSEPGTENLERFSEFLIQNTEPDSLGNSAFAAPATTLLKDERVPKAVVITGLVTLDGEALPNARIEFRPADGQASIVTTDENGRYELNDLKNLNQSIIGTNKVTISTYRPSDANEKETPELVPEHFSNPEKTELMCAVKEGSNKINFELTK